MEIRFDFIAIEIAYFFQNKVPKSKYLNDTWVILLVVVAEKHSVSFLLLWNLHINFVWAITLESLMGTVVPTHNQNIAKIPKKTWNVKFDVNRIKQFSFASKHTMPLIGKISIPNKMVFCTEKSFDSWFDLKIRIQPFLNIIGWKQFQFEECQVLLIDMNFSNAIEFYCKNDCMIFDNNSMLK